MKNSLMKIHTSKISKFLSIKLKKYDFEVSSTYPMTRNLEDIGMTHANQSI